MKFDCGLTRGAKQTAKEQWHRWFAWCPVRIGERECVWGETIERKGTLNGCSQGLWWDWKYRLCA